MALGTTPTFAVATALALTVVLSACVEYVRPAPEDASAPIDETPAEAPSLASAATPDVLTPMGWDPDHPPALQLDVPFGLETGALPSLDQARAFDRQYSRFVAKGDGGLEKLRREGHLAGDGSVENPYVLEEFYVDGELSITSTDKAIIIREGYVNGQLKLNYIGSDVYVHHVYARDLRINENVKRDGPNTGGLFHDNKFAFVGQIRHFIGEFMQNEIGPRPQTVIQEYVGDSGIAKVPPGVVFNFDGFHGADVHHNRFLGQVDIKLHGHNHADCFVCPVHNHDDASEHPGGSHNHTAPSEDLGFRTRHSVRYVSLVFRDNEIRVPDGIALRYNDRAHAGDDRTANSEPNEYLKDPHVHFQDITIRENRLIGGSLQIDVFNAPDERHPVQNKGILRLWDNEVEVRYEPPTTTQPGPTVFHGIHVRIVDGLELRARGNTVRFTLKPADMPGEEVQRSFAPKVELRGFTLENADASNLTLAKNVVESGKVGVFGFRFTESVRWILRGNDFRTDEAWRAKETHHPPEEER